MDNQTIQVLFAIARGVGLPYADLCQRRLEFDLQTASSEEEIWENVRSENPARIIVLDYAFEEQCPNLCEDLKKALKKRADNINPSVIVIDPSLEYEGKQERADNGVRIGANHFLQVGFDGIEGLINSLRAEIGNLIYQMENTYLVKQTIKLVKKVQEEKEKADRMAREDPLTGAGNRASLEEDFSKMRASCKRNDEQLAWIMYDIDFFKDINDIYGHATGDSVLKHIVKITRNTIRENDLIIRYGGEEFVVLASVKNRVDGQILAEKIRKAIENSPCTKDGKPPSGIKCYDSDTHMQKDEKLIETTVSIGQVILEEEESLDKISKRADKLLYEAKAKGRNKVCSDFARKSVTVERDGNILKVDFAAA